MQQVRLAARVAVLGFCFALATSSAGSAKEADAGAFLLSLSREASAKLGDASLSEAQKEDNFRQLFRSAFDLPAISRFVLGKYWRDASEAQRNQFTAEFEELNMLRFLPQFAKYDTNTIKVESVQAEQGKPDLSNVNTRIFRPDSEPISVVWRIRDTGTSYKIYDIVAEGVSMAISLRHEYGEVVALHGIDGLLKEMHDKIAELAVH